MKNLMIRILNTLVATTFFVALTACETPTDNAIEQARQCSDKAAQLALTNAALAQSSGAGATCIAMLGSANTAEANQIRFGDILIEDGILGNIASAAGSETSKAGNVDALNSMLLVLIDPVPTDVIALTNAANSSNSAGMVYVASLIGMATTLSQLSGTLLTNGTAPQNVPTSISNCTGACATALQTSYNTMATAACSNSGTGNATLCAKAAAINTLAGPNPTAAQLVSALATYAQTAH